MKRKYLIIDTILLFIILIFLSLIFLHALYLYNNRENFTMNFTTAMVTTSIGSPIGMATTSTTTSTSIPITSTNTAPTTTTSTIPAKTCLSHSDCGKEYYYGTYFCDGENIALLKYIPRCRSGTCKYKTEIETIRTCRGNRTCIPGLKRCLLGNESMAPAGSIILKVDNKTYSEAYGYRFKIDYIEYKPYYEISFVLIDVLRPDMTELQVACSWDVEARVDDLRIGIYSATASHVSIWINKD